MNDFLKKAKKAQEKQLNKLFGTSLFICGFGSILIVISFFIPTHWQIGVREMGIFLFTFGFGAVSSSLRISENIIAKYENFSLMEDGALREEEETEKEK